MTQMRSTEEQIVGLHEVATAAAKLHRINTQIIANVGDVVALTGAVHGRRVEVVYAVDGYDLWVDAGDGNGHRLMAADVPLALAAEAVAEAYMMDKAAMILARDGMTNEQINAFLGDDFQKQAYYARMDEGSDRMQAVHKQQATS